MDIVLPGVDGIDAAAEIRNRFDIPVVFLTAHMDERTIQRAKLTFPLGYLLKPFDGRLLHTTIEMGLSRHKLEKALRENVELKKGKTIFIEDLTPHPGFGGIHIAVRAFKVCDGLGIITTDITERKRMEEELQKCKAQLQYLLREKNSNL